jgi:predicted ATPase/transcriptional regulator with XRE-family HTH domain
MSGKTTRPFGDLLRSYRLAAGLTQEALAERAGVGTRSIRALEQGDTRPLKGTARRLATGLNLGAEDHARFVAAAVPIPRRHARAGSAPAPGHLDAPAGDLRPPSSDALPNNLPLQLTTFVGRAQEIGDVSQLLTSVRLLTLTGTAGVGKTRLALQIAAGMLRRYAHGIWLVELGALSDPTLVPHTVATALGVPDTPGRPLLPLLVEALRPKQLLLVLDTCEHLLEACAVLAETLLGADPQVQVLATSREALGILGETIWHVPSLAVPRGPALPPPELLAQYEAVHLFVDRARAAQPRFTLSEANAAAVAQICTRLDGIPLALELAAARVRGLGVEEVAARLDHQFTLLTRGSRTALPRHQTLRATMDWSYDLLTDPERALFDRLSVFAGRFTLAAAEAVCAGEDIAAEDVLNLLMRVVDKSLVHVDEAAAVARYRLLDSVRQYGHERLEARGEAALVQARHASYYLALVERAGPELRSPAAVAWLDRLEAELDNIRAALSWCLDAEEALLETAADGPEQAHAIRRGEVGLRVAGALFELWYWRAHRREGLQWLERALSHESATPARAKALIGAGALTWALGDRERGHALFADALAIYRGLGPTSDFAFALSVFGFFVRGRWSDEARTSEDFEQGAQSLEEGLAVAEDVDDPLRIAWARVLLALTVDLRRDDERARARALGEQSLAFYERIGDHLGIGLANRALGGVALYEQDCARARTAFSAQVAALRAFGDVAGVAFGSGYLGHVARAQGDIAGAVAHYEESLALYREIDFERAAMAHVLRCLGDVALEQSDHERAWARYTESLVRAHEAVAPRRIAEALEALARLAVAQGRPRRALWLAGAAAALRESIVQPLPLAEQATLVRTLAQARQALTVEQQAAEWARGAAMTPEQAMAAATDDAPDSAAEDRSAPAAGHAVGARPG